MFQDISLVIVVLRYIKFWALIFSHYLILKLNVSMNTFFSEDVYHPRHNLSNEQMIKKKHKNLECKLINNFTMMCI